MGCDKCDHLFLAAINSEFNEQLYANYYYLYPYSNLESMERAYRQPFERVFNFFAGESGVGKTLLEIGCSSHEQLALFQTKGFRCTGISPGADAARSECLIDGFYEAVPFSSQFDCVVSRFNLEHVIDLEMFLNKVRTELATDGVLFVQVPNVHAFLAGGMIGVFAHEHPHYFSRGSLSAALERAGFEIELIQSSVLDPSIIAVARKRDVSLRNTDLTLRNRGFANSVIDLMRNDEEANFVFYGAGLSLCTLLYMDGRISEFEARMLIVDDNPLLLGRCMPNTSLAIFPLKAVASPKNSVLFVFLNGIYHHKVLPQVQQLGFKKIYYLNGEGVQEYS